MGRLYRLTRHSILLLQVGLICFAAQGQEQQPGFSFKKLMMPGELHRTHAKFEHECDSCHGTSSTDSSAKSLCLDCHKDIATDLTGALGFHGRSALVKTGECQACHSDHLGREGDIVNFDIDHFDHSLSDFQLDGGHLGLTCKACHAEDKKFRDTPTECVSCHLKDDRHKGAFKQSCADCHTTQKWKDSSFDHDSTDFALLGKHQQTSCKACHPDQKYVGTPKECVSCHIINDVHGGNNGKECKSCHQQQDWQKIIFDHNTDTDFSLHGGHVDVSCHACHIRPVFTEKPGNTCVDCHKNDDQHRGLNGTNCKVCHAETHWSDTNFEHNSDTDFELQGKHIDLSCTSCHPLGSNHNQARKACIDCHSKDDVHKGQLSHQCDTCHNQIDWPDKVRFDHELSNFPLVGMHAIASCGSCHAAATFHDAKSACIDCHLNDDFHERTLGADCASCHNPNDWLLWQFDHGLQTTFPLEGAHEGLSCSACHIEAAKNKVEQDSACYACHAQDDKHQGKYGRQCKTCHLATDFAQIRVK